MKAGATLTYETLVAAGGGPIERANTQSQAFAFSPDWGDEDWRLWELIAACEAGLLKETTEEMLVTTVATTGFDALKASYCLSLLLDLLKAGANFWTRDSRLFVQWPDWSSSEGRANAFAAMNAAREMRGLTPREMSRVRPLFAPDLSGQELAVVLAEGNFSLETAAGMHPSGICYQEAFAAALRYWSMPYRGRTGRMKRFVLLAEHPLLGSFPVVAGIVELGDEAPFCRWRDDLLGLNTESFKRWISTCDDKTVKGVIRRFSDLRKLLRPTSDGIDLSSISALDLVKRFPELEAQSQGRSLVREDQKELLKDRKRLAYGVRLAKGEVALKDYLKSKNLENFPKWMAEGVRGVHDLMIPRVHLEVTVCGAVPPFTTGLGGKLVISFLSHPSIAKATLGSQSELLNWSFDYKRLSDQLPSGGMLCLTTKGLYAKHAAIYTRSEMPGIPAPLKFRHLANTLGTTTTLLSDRTAKFAKAVVDFQEGLQVKVSSVYGSGGAKRHRFIEAATLASRLPARMPFAGIPRPVYGTLFVKNAEAVCWLNQNPIWTIDRHANDHSFVRAATDLWRKRWLSRAVARCMEYATLPSLPSVLTQED